MHCFPANRTSCQRLLFLMSLPAGAGLSPSTSGLCSCCSALLPHSEVMTHSLLFTVCPLNLLLTVVVALEHHFGHRNEVLCSQRTFADQLTNITQNVQTGCRTVAQSRGRNKSMRETCGALPQEVSVLLRHGPWMSKARWRSCSPASMFLSFRMISITVIYCLCLVPPVK